MAPLRRKSQGSIRSPPVKRNVQSQVTLEGWLFKLEGGALKQWKQRWCVLVDFCLFFYKAPHEEKVVSSILLPSYKINPCSADDKASKKFAFKASHQNMKTYYFAAEDKEGMKKWMNAMSLATIMQKSTYDDDDSGFTSYRSHRTLSNEASSDYTGQPTCETLKQRSNSYGDRVGEMYLGSDDKYPSLYKSTPSQLWNAQQDVPRKQPLYANAPPKPRRLTQTDGFNEYPGDCFDRREPDLVHVEPALYDAENMYRHQDNSVQYTPANLDDSHATSYLDPTCENFCNDSAMKPPRPRSADFLGKENECFVPQYTSQCYENRQPQRPKSSLDYYNRFMDSEDYHFDDYREAVRLQADHFYANKNLMKNRNIQENQRQTENIIQSDSNPNANYDSYNSFSGTSVPSTFSSDHRKGPLLKSGANSRHRRNYYSQSNSKPASNESMQRLLEWKQRMLQSPLCRRNQLHSVSSDVSSFSSSKQVDNSQHTLKNPEAHGQSIRYLAPENPLIHQNQSLVEHEIRGPFSSFASSTSGDELERTHPSRDNCEMQYDNSETFEKCADAADTLNQKNIMYCVDSENNEILFSYDSSPVDSVVAPAMIHSTHYPPQMHSFSTLPNVNDIGMEALPISECSERKNRHLVSQSKQDPSYSGKISKRITYSSDDEDEVEDLNSMKPKELTTGDPSFRSSSPDYVNIGAVFGEVDADLTSGMYSSDCAFRSSVPVNKAVLKQINQVSKNSSTHLPSLDTAENLVTHKVENVSCKTKDISKNKDFIEEGECDIKREDYIRASQIFYSSMRMKNRLRVSPHKNTQSCISDKDPQDIIKKVDSLDKDIGLPLSTSKVSFKTELVHQAASASTCIDPTSFDSIKKCSEKEKNDENIETAVIKSEKNIPSQEVKKNLSYEEMRGQLLRKREAPPPNIVQDRIKKFERNKEAEKLFSNHIKVSDGNLHSAKVINRNSLKKSNSKNHSKSQKRSLHSDSEAIALEDSDLSSDDLTMKSAPLLLSPLSSVLADLRKTANSDKENTSGNYIHSRDSQTHSESFSFDDFSGDFMQNNEDAVYLPMSGIRTAKEPEYVTMSDSKLSQSTTDSSKSKSTKYKEEHVYNEPFPPPPSFLHDVYGKQKSKLFQCHMESCSSDDSLTENIYEKPIKRFSADGIKDNRILKLAEKSGLMSRVSSLSATSLEHSNPRDVFPWNNSKKNHYDQVHISVSVPDLLQLQEVKDSDASDADDEASRDFDTAGNTTTALSYQKTVLDSFYATDNSLSLPMEIDSKPDSSKMSFSFYQANENTPSPKMFGKISEFSSAEGATALVKTESAEELNMHTNNYEQIIHVRKLRVYTKGKKAETPRMFPVPFNLEETEKSEVEMQKSDEFRYQRTEPNNCSLSENVAYITKADISTNADINSDADNFFSHSSPSVPASYTPDIISSINEEGRQANLTENTVSKLSSSAPYYYSDLYSDYGLNVSSFKQMDMPYTDKTSPPKSCTSLLNNIRPKSPCANKSDIGRKVNNINVEPRERPILCDKFKRSEETKNNIKLSMGVFQSSESKYLDAEKNKYEVGSTLEKTRTTNTIPYLKQRASTPELNVCQYQSNEPVYENILFQSKRMSQSLEELAATSEFQTHQAFPVYENIDFLNRFEMPQKESAETFQVSLCFPDQYNFSQKCVDDSKLYLSNNENVDDQQEVHFLDQSGHKSDLKIKPSSKAVDHAGNTFNTNEDTAVIPSVDFELSKGSYHYLIPSGKATSLPKYKMNDSDSLSDASSSCDEASAESDNRHQRILGGFHSSGSSLDVRSKEAMHLKKLVQQSQGLMCRGKRLSVSAGDLLGKTHEELVLLLIQLRRNQSKLLKTKEKLENKINREKNGQIELCNQISHLEKQYEVTQPLVTLVDNMVKLGSLYGNSNRRSFSLPILDSSENEPSNCPASNETNILSRLIKEDHHLQKHIQEINKMEKSLQNETNSISTLHQDKEMLEHTLFGMRNKILDHQDRPAELQKLRKQQRMIEKELVRVKRLLNTSAKKIEDATSKNDQMEQEILYLRQILQQALKTGSTEMKTSQRSRADLEVELTRLQSVLDELANHRQEINSTVEKLKSDASCSRSNATEVRASPTGVAGSAPLPLRKKHHCMYLETDLDTMVTRDLAVSYEKDFDDIPVYANAEEVTLSNEEYGTVPSTVDPASKADATDPEMCSLQDINEADERMKRFYGILPKEKPSEIKTVRIVKRQSERRSRGRDKKKVSYDEESSVWIMDEPDLSSDDYLEMEEKITQKPSSFQVNRPSSIQLPSASSTSSANAQSAHERLFGKHRNLLHTKSNGKSKRRHYTVSGYQYILDPQFSQYFTEMPRSRDDVDMERCLRTANTPDIVRSTIKKKDVFDDTIIDRELGLPQKIEIPERYVEIEPEQLSATEKLQRSLKAENICKMLSQTSTSYSDVAEKPNSPDALHKKLSEEKRKRAQLLSLNQVLAREVVERSKAVAANVYPLENQAAS